MDMDLQGRVAVVTGSGSGIGRAAVRAFAKEGAHVVVTDIVESRVRETVGLLADEGVKALGLTADVCNPEQVENMFAQIFSHYKKVDILVNNAGFSRDMYLTKMPLSAWDGVIDTILKGAFLCCKSALPSMMQQRWGRVINISSRAHLGNPGQTNYSAAKAGLIGFTRSLAFEQGKFNITANAIAPGLIDTELLRSMDSYEKLSDNALLRNAVPRIGRPEEVADAILFLASERAAFITGETLHVTGGRYST